MGLVCLPIHVWDREIDSRILLSVLLLKEGHDIALGHEYNLSTIYGSYGPVYQLHNGRPTNTYRSSEWRKPIKANGGMTSLILEEGINDQSPQDFQRHYLGVTEESISYVDKIFSWTSTEKNQIINHLKNKIGIKQDLSRKIDVTSNTRLELLGSLGRIYYGDIT